MCYKQTNIIDPAVASAVAESVAEAKSVAIVCHTSPDGDAIGSSLCLWHLLMAHGIEAKVIFPDVPPHNLQFLPGVSKAVIAYNHLRKAKNIIAKADLIFCLDFNDFHRTDSLERALAATTARKIMVDHHLNPVLQADISISFPEKSSTCALVYHLIEALGWMGDMSVEAATCCCAGMMTDTGNFSYNSNDPDLYRILVHLVSLGVDKDDLYTRIFNVNSISRLRIMGYGQYAKMQVFPDHGAALITLSREELERLDYRRGDTESLVNVPLSIPGIYFSTFLREDEPDYVKVSMRSKGDFSVKELCERYFGGGGHCNAAGGESYSSLADTEAKVLEIINQCNK